MTETRGDRLSAWWNGAALCLLALTSKALHAAGSPIPLATTVLVVSMASASLFGAASPRGAPFLRFELPLSFGLVLLGTQMVPEQLAKIGLSSVLWLGGYWITMAGLFWVAVRSGIFNSRVGGLLAVGLSGSGIAAVKAAARSDRQAPPEALPLATSGILLAGAVGFVLCSELSKVLRLDADQVSRWAGIALPTTAEAVLVGAAHSERASQQTAAWRLLINLLQFIPVLVYLQLFVDREDRPSRHRFLGSVGSTLRRIPLFVFGLAMVGALGWLDLFEPRERSTLREMTNWAFLLALAGIGFNTRPSQVWKLGVVRIAIAVALWATCLFALLGLVVLWDAGDP